MLLDAFRKEVPYCPYINTGTLFDLATGKYRQSTTGGWVLDGGLSQCLGIMGRAQTFKSSLAGSLLARALSVHPQAEAIVYETEGAVASEERYDDFVPQDSPVRERIVFHSATDYNLTNFYDDFTEAVETKLKNKKDYMVESPFLNPKTGKPYKIWIPTFILVDSFSRARTGKGEEQYGDTSIDDSALNSSWLVEGNFKSRIMSDMPTRAAKAGIYVIMTAHVGEKYILNPYAPNQKQLQYMKSTDKMKNVGSNFEFLTTTLLQTIRASVLQNKDKKCEYPTHFSTDVEVNQVDTMMVRCKNNASGVQIPFIVSQYQGILDSVTNFNLLRTYKEYGLEIQGNKQAFAPVLTPEKFVRKSNLRELTEKDYELRRALELLAELCFVQNLWSTWKLPNYVHMAPEVLAEKLKNSQKCTISRALNSTGVWSTSKLERERLTLMDILMMLDKEDTHPVTTIGAATTQK